jgi:hypothetical protein
VCVEEPLFFELDHCHIYDFTCVAVLFSRSIEQSMRKILNKRVKTSSDTIIATESVIDNYGKVENSGVRSGSHSNTSNNNHSSNSSPSDAEPIFCDVATASPTASRMPAADRGVGASRVVHRSASDHQKVERRLNNTTNAMLISTISEHGPAVGATNPASSSLGPKKRVVIRRNHSSASTSSTVSTTASKTSSGSGSSPSEGRKKGTTSATPKIRSCLKRNSSSSRRNNEKKANGVHWNHKVEKKRHVRRQDMTDQEREAVWYTEGDTKIILAMAKVTVKMMMKGEACDDVDYCSRGLEGKTPTGSKQRQQNKLQVRRALLEEQEIQREEAVLDAEYLVQVSLKNSKEVRMQAHQTALQDEQDVREYLTGSGTLISHRDILPVPPRRRKKS